MELDPDSLTARDMYQWLIDTIIPRPIAWVSTLSAGGAANLAPFSFFTGVCARPPILMFCPANDRHGRKKDTLLNIEATGEFVINLVPADLAAPMNATAATLPHGDSEFEAFGVAACASTVVRPPRVAQSPVAFECRLNQIVRLSEGPIGGNAVFGQIVRLHLADTVLGAGGRPDPLKIDPVARVGSDAYTRLGKLFHLTRPN
jgi:flavin reductase (DIM6/NTAB) family NADH-FMN oxidoreductase RutF